MSHYYHSQSNNDPEQVSQGLHGHYREILTAYWQQTINTLENEDHDYKVHQLPLARIKKVMKADPDVKMISAEAPILFAKGCDIFITELTMRAWIHAEENKRRTLQRSDIASALTKSDMFDFLIDIVPREEAAPKRPTGGASASTSRPQQPPPPPPPAQTSQPPQQSGHHNTQQLGGPEYGMHPGMPDTDRYPAAMYGQSAVAQPQQGYPHQLYSEGLDNMYGYPPIPTQTMYQMPNQQAHLQDNARPEQGDEDADAEGERDYEVP
ncbi:histone-fold-containing protein [Pyronema omphalodes]|nr:histone-fold-containing protein [Pyronema omphalodes]